MGRTLNKAILMEMEKFKNASNTPYISQEQ